MAVSRALGNSLSGTGRTFKRDHTTVRSAVRAYCDRQAARHAEARGEADLFRNLITAALDVAQRRAAGGTFTSRGAA